MPSMRQVSFDKQKRYGKRILQPFKNMIDLKEKYIAKCIVCGKMEETFEGIPFPHGWIYHTADINMEALTCSQNCFMLYLPFIAEADNDPIKAKELLEKRSEKLES